MSGRAAQEQNMTTEGLEIIEQAKVMTITNDGEDAAAGEFLVRVKALRKKIKGYFDPICDATHKAHKIATAKRKEAEGPVATAEAIVKREIGDYFTRKTEAARVIAEEQRRVAREVAEAEQLERAVELEDKGWTAEAEAVVSAPVAPVVVPAPAVKPSTKGVSVRVKPQFKINDPAKINAAFMVPDEKKIRQIVNSMGAEAVAIVGEGLEVWQEEIVSARV